MTQQQQDRATTTDEQQHTIRRLERSSAEEAKIKWDLSHVPSSPGFQHEDGDCLVIFKTGRYVIGADGTMKLILPGV